MHNYKQKKTNLTEGCSLDGKKTFLFMSSPPLTKLRYSATLERPDCVRTRALASHTQQWTPRRPEYTHRICLNEQSPVELVYIQWRLELTCQQHVYRTIINKECYLCVYLPSSTIQEESYAHVIQSPYIVTSNLSLNACNILT